MVEQNADRGLKEDEGADMETKSVDNSVEEWSRNGAEVGSEGAQGHFNPRC